MHQLTKSLSLSLSLSPSPPPLILPFSRDGEDGKGGEGEWEPERAEAPLQLSLFKDSRCYSVGLIIAKLTLQIKPHVANGFVFHKLSSRGFRQKYIRFE